WHVSDPPDDFEMYRNNYIYTWQMNRNPFIDMPSLAQYIYGNNQGQTWQNPNAIGLSTLPEITIFPNPAQYQINVLGLPGEFSWELYNLFGQRVSHGNGFKQSTIPLNLPAGLYTLKLKTASACQSFKVLVQP
ncbi:MAG: T9SS type A sorting domain-containing protein, partial [Chitinophagaceae bacterium]